MKLTKDQREALRQMFDGRCAYCGQPLGDRWHADHVEHVERQMKWAPRGDIGTSRLVSTGKVHRPERDTFENLMPACPPCNIDKSVFSIEEWRKKLHQSCRVLSDHQPTYRHAVRFGLVQETGARIVFHFEKVREGQPA